MFTKRSAKKSSIVGLDLDPSHLAAAEVSVNGHVSVTKAALTLLRPGVLRDGEVADAEALTQALRDLFTEHELPTRVRLGVANQRIVVRTLDLPPKLDDKALQAAVALEAPDHIPMPMDEAILDFQKVGIVETPAGPRTRVVIVAVRREMVETLISAATAAGLQVEGIDLSAFAMVRALAAPGDPARLYVNVSGLTNVAVADCTGVFFARTAVGGLDTLVHLLAERRSLTVEHARQWLGYVGLEAPLEQIEGDADVVGATRSVLEEGAGVIAEAIRGSLDYYRAQEGSQPVQEALLTGPASAIPGFAERLSQHLGLPVARAAVATAPEAGSVTDADRLTVAAGLAVEERNLQR